jgi:hypothetical protein
VYKTRSKDRATTKLTKLSNRMINHRLVKHFL